MIGGVVVTGASSGIGAAIVRALRSRGFTVIGTVRREEDKAAPIRNRNLAWRTRHAASSTHYSAGVSGMQFGMAYCVVPAS